MRISDWSSDVCSSDLMPASSTMPAGQAFGSAVGVTRHHVENAHEIRLGVRMTPLAKQEVHAASHPFWAKPGVIRGIEDDVVRGFFDRHSGFKQIGRAHV